MATHSSILAWRIPWTEEPGGLQSMGWQRVRQTERLTLSHFSHECEFQGMRETLETKIKNENLESLDWRLLGFSHKLYILPLFKD